MGWADGLVALVAVLAVATYFGLVLRVGAARRKYNIAAPATSGHPSFERIFRVQQNTLEQLPILLVSLYFFGHYLNALAAAILGALWIAGRIVYMEGYVRDPPKRAPGAMISFGVLIVLLAGAIIGVGLAIASAV